MANQRSAPVVSDNLAEVAALQQGELTDKQRKAAIDRRRAEAEANDAYAAGFAPDETEPGGHYVVNGMAVDADGEPIKAKAKKAPPDDPPSDPPKPNDPPKE